MLILHFNPDRPTATFHAIAEHGSVLSTLSEHAGSRELEAFLGDVAMMLAVAGTDHRVIEAIRSKYPDECNAERPGPWFDCLEGIASVLGLIGVLDQYAAAGGDPETLPDIASELQTLKEHLQVGREAGARFHFRLLV